METKAVETKKEQKSLKDKIWDNRGKLIFAGTAALGIHLMFKFGFLAYYAGRNEVLNTTLIKSAKDSKDGSHIGEITVQKVLDHMKESGETIHQIVWNGNSTDDLPVRE